MLKRVIAVIAVVVGLSVPSASAQTVTETFTYNPAGELVSVERSGPPSNASPQDAATETVRFQYDGDDLAAVYDESGALLERYVTGPDGEVLAIISAAGAISYPLQDAQGSTIAITDASGAATATLAYDEYGQPRAGNMGRMQYTGQMWLPDAGVYHYGARAYHPALGRFMQTDPVGYAEGLNLYGYVGNDPVNQTDPTGMFACETLSTCQTYWREADMGPSPQQAVRNGNYLWPIVRQNLADLVLIRFGGRPSAVPASASEAAMVRRVPNPYGSRGGPAHQERVAQRIRQLEDEGMTHTGGGSRREEVVRTEGGAAQSRRPDITMTRPDGSRYRENVGRQNQNGQPVARERRAQRDIEQATGQCGFTPYNNC